jgi:hypothetical protein
MMLFEGKEKYYTGGRVMGYSSQGVLIATMSDHQNKLPYTSRGITGFSKWQARSPSSWHQQTASLS